MNVMQTDHVFFRARKNAKVKILKSQRKEVVANVYDYFEKVSRRQLTKAPLTIGLQCV